MTVKLVTEHNLEFLSLKGCCTGWSEYTLVKMPHCWKSNVTAQIHFSLAGMVFSMHMPGTGGYFAQPCTCVIVLPWPGGVNWSIRLVITRNINLWGTDWRYIDC